ncbi:hypothetical protein [uncultured Winogradskyella sp.]|tara:strand:+ start:133 stop:279 length:147 start_codon:yes stop_codon:yes gene_type:complete
MKPVKKVKKVLPKVLVQFTFKGKLNEVNESFKGTESQEKLLISKKLIK